MIQMSCRVGSIVAATRFLSSLRGLFQQSRLCVDGPGLARFDLTVMQFGRVQLCVRPVDAAFMAAGRNAIRGSGPNYKRGLEAP